jgi:hypothetical protein
LALFLGSNIGNFDRPEAEAFLRSIRRRSGRRCAAHGCRPREA